MRGHRLGPVSWMFRVYELILTGVPDRNVHSYARSQGVPGSLVGEIFRRDRTEPPVTISHSPHPIEDDVTVLLVRWPRELAALERARRCEVPRLLLVEESAPPPSLEDELEDWVRLPAPRADVQARIDALARRTGRRRRPELDDDGVLHLGDAWVSIPPVEARMVALLVERFGGVVPGDALAKAGWPEGLPNRNVLDVHVLRLRRRLQSVGLALHNVRRRGYVLDVTQDGSETRQVNAPDA
jgi:hypothetical protein